MPRNCQESDLLKGKAKNNPKLQTLIDNIDDMDLADIQDLDQPKWVKTGLTQILKQEGKAGKEAIADLIASIVFEDLTDKNQHKLYRRLGDDLWVGNKLKVLVRCNDLFLITPEGIHYDHTDKVFAEGDLQKLLRGSKLAGTANKDQYFQKVRDELNAKHGNSINNIEEPNENGGLFKFRRH